MRSAGIFFLLGTALAPAAEEKAQFRAGAFAVDITPQEFPVVVNGNFFPAIAERARDPLHARCLVLDDGRTRAAICIVDTCLIPRELADAAKARVERQVGIPGSRILIAATHTHSAPSLMEALGSEADPRYPPFLVERIAEGFRNAAANLAPAKVGWAVAKAPDHTHCRTWIRRPDRMEVDPFGERSVRCNMHPGHQNPDAIGPSGPKDPDLSLLSVRSIDGRPIALLANYSMHYFGDGVAPVSADYFGAFAEKIRDLIGAREGEPPFVGIMSQGTSGDQMWMDYDKPRRRISMEDYAGELARIAFDAWKGIEHGDGVSIAMADRDLPLAVRLPDPKRLAWARETVKAMEGRTPKTLPEIYAKEQLWLVEHPLRSVKLQAIRIGGLGIAAISAEVFALSGLKIKARSPLDPTFTIELANGADGYIPPPELHRLGGYNTWACRTACLEAEAEPKIVEGVLELLEEVAGNPRRPAAVSQGPYARSVLAAKPVAYWRMEEMDGPKALDATGGGHHGRIEGGVAFFLDGPAAAAFSGEGAVKRAVNRAVHFAGGRMAAALDGLGPAYSVEMWFWNGLPSDARPGTGHLFSRGAPGAPGAPGDHLLIGGTRSVPGRLVFASMGDGSTAFLVGRTEIAPRTWHHATFARDGKRVAIYLNGKAELEAAGEAEIRFGDPAVDVCIGGRSDGAEGTGFEGKIDEVAVYDRPLSPEEIAARFRAAGVER